MGLGIISQFDDRCLRAFWVNPGEILIVVQPQSPVDVESGEYRVLEHMYVGTVHTVQYVQYGVHTSILTQLFIFLFFVFFSADK